jgi:hypothetical protein
MTHSQSPCQEALHAPLTFNLAAYNAWAAGGPPEPEAYKRIFEERSNMFFVGTCVTGAAFLIFSGWNLIVFIRHRRQQNPR